MPSTNPKPQTLNPHAFLIPVRVTGSVHEKVETGLSGQVTAPIVHPMNIYIIY